MNKLGSMKKRYILSLISVACIFVLGGCSLTEKLFTDSGTDVVEKIDASQYLDLSVLEKVENPGEEQSWNGYEVYTITYGTFSTKIVGTRANITMIEINQIKAEITAGTMILKEICVMKNDYVEKGDVVARVSVETSDLDLEELELKLQRLEEEYAEVTAEYNEQHEEDIANISVWEYPGKIDRVEIAQSEMNFERTKANYEKQIAAYKEQISELKKMRTTTEIVASDAGFVLEMGSLQLGQELANGTVICSIAPTDKIMLEFADESLHYGYGMDLTLVVGDARGRSNTKEYDAKAVSVLGKALIEDWNQTTTKIEIEEDLGNLIGNGPYTVTGETNVMENVLLVPADAVTKDSDKYFVTVLNADETLEKRQFIPGGQNTEYYWVFDGLNPGTKIIIEN